jgi:hypothetical protein
MNYNYMNQMRFGYGLDHSFAVYLLPVFLLLLAWTFFWKGLALWHSAKRGDTWWFIALLFINTLGILEIIYLFAVAKKHWSNLW